MSKIHTLVISRKKLEELLQLRTNVVSHVCTANWNRFFNKKANKVRLVELQFYESAIFNVIEIKKAVSLGETIVVIKLEKV